MPTESKGHFLRKNWVSVIIPTYNRARDLKESISSVLKQSYPDRDIIVADDGSTDDTGEIASIFKKDIQFLRLPHSGLPAVARNAGLKVAQGEYIAFLDSDDTWKENKLEEQIKHFQEKEVIGVGTDAVILSSTPYYRQLDFGKSSRGYKDYDYFSILSENPVKTSSAIVRGDLIKEMGGFDEDPKLRFIEDYELWLRMAQKGIFRILEKKLIFYRMHFDKSRKNLEIAINTSEIIKKHIKTGYLKDQKLIAEAEATTALMVGYNLLFQEGYEGRHYYLDAYRKSSLINKKIKAGVGLFLSIQPMLIRKPCNYLFHKTDKIISLVKGLL